MSFVHEEHDFCGGEAYSDYRRSPRFKERAQAILNLGSVHPGDSVLVAGCGFGFLVEALSDLGFTNAWGIDASRYATEVAAPREIGDLSERIVRGDILSVEDLDRMASIVGVDEFRLTVSEDVLPCADDKSEASEMLVNLSAVSQRMYHIITPKLGITQEDIYLWLSEDEWISMVGDDPVYWSLP